MVSSTGSQVFWMSIDMCTELHPVWSRGSVFSGNGWGIDIFTQLLFSNFCWKNPKIEGISEKFIACSLS